MTKKNWKEFLERLKAFRTTNKFRTEIVYYPYPISIYDDGSKCKRIDKVDTNELYIRFNGREYITHADVINITPKEISSKFFVTMNVFNIDKVKFN